MKKKQPKSKIQTGRGGARPGAGRKKGQRNKKTAARLAAIEASGLTPLDFLITVMRAADVPLDMRFDAAKSAAPYVHPKLAAIEHTGKDGGPIETRKMGDLEVARRLAFILDSARRKQQSEAK